jgi:hypothetical protein
VCAINKVTTVTPVTKPQWPNCVVCAGELLTHPRPIDWVASHTNCDVGKADGLAIQAKDLDSPLKALHFTLHMQSNSWYEGTNWRELMEQIYPEYGVRNGD